MSVMNRDCEASAKIGSQFLSGVVDGCDPLFEITSQRQAQVGC